MSMNTLLEHYDVLMPLVNVTELAGIYIQKCYVTMTTIQCQLEHHYLGRRKKAFWRTGFVGPFLCIRLTMEPMQLYTNVV